VASPVHLNVVTAGDGIPVVLLHGLTATHRYVVMGSRQLERSGHRVIAYDARGHGASDAPSSRAAYEYDDLLADLLAVLDAEGVERAVLAGASMGAHTALKAAIEAPERVAGLVVTTPAYDPVTHGDAVSLERWDALSDGLRTGGVEGFVAAYDLDEVPHAWRETVATVLRQRLSRHDHPDAVADALRVVPRSRPFDTLRDLAAIESIPTVVVADRDEADPGHPLAVGQEYAAAIPGATLVVEAEGKSPLAWQGGQLSRVIADLAARAT
jgi:pimeloyl-ACP methyl ester carboxylesterase